MWCRDDEHFMCQALIQARRAFEEKEVPVGAVIVSRDRIIARSHNLTEKFNDVTAHAEMQAITSACDFLGAKYLKGCTLYVTLEPCVMCAGALYWSQISRVVFAASDPKRGFLSSNISLHPKTEIAYGILEQDSRALLLKFFGGLRSL